MPAPINFIRIDIDDIHITTASLRMLFSSNSIATLGHIYTHFSIQDNTKIVFATIQQWHDTEDAFLFIQNLHKYNIFYFMNILPCRITNKDELNLLPIDEHSYFIDLTLQTNKIRYLDYKFDYFVVFLRSKQQFITDTINYQLTH